MQNEIQTLIGKIKEDYINWTSLCGSGNHKSGSYFAETIANFEDNVQVKYGKKYIKIVKDNGVWGFIVNTDNDKLFKKGDILKAAGYNTPARNAARGNVFEDYSVAWTGPHYLK
jgi:hypothetical protein